MPSFNETDFTRPSTPNINLSPALQIAVPR